MTALHLDTHVIVWLAAGEHARIPSAVKARLGTGALLHSPQVRMELEYLAAKGVLTATPEQVLGSLRGLGLREETSMPYDRVVDCATDAAMRDWEHRDPFDRLIVAHARADGALLITKDQRIREYWSGALAIWD
ncbi:MAG: PIN domain-containing protein [Patulibacter sp.]